MKKINILAVIAVSVIMTSCGTSKQVTSQTQQTVYEEDGAKQVVAELNRQGYTPYGSYSMFTLYELVNRTRNKIMEDSERYIPIEGVGEGNDLSSSKMFALNNASIAYATQAGSKITGKMSTQFSNLTESTRTKIAGAYEQKISEFIMPILTENYIVGRREGSKMFVLANYMVDEVKAKEARKVSIDEAVKQVAKEVALEQAFMDSVRELVEEQPIE